MDEGKAITEDSFTTVIYTYVRNNLRGLCKNVKLHDNNMSVLFAAFIRVETIKA